MKSHHDYNDALSWSARADLDAALARASQDADHVFEFDEVDRHLIDQAAEAADRAEGLRKARPLGKYVKVATEDISNDEGPFEQP